MDFAAYPNISEVIRHFSNSREIYDPPFSHAGEAALLRTIVRMSFAQRTSNSTHMIMPSSAGKALGRYPRIEVLLREKVVQYTGDVLYHNAVLCLSLFCAHQVAKLAAEINWRVARKPTSPPQTL